MADITLFGETYRDVPAVELPKSGGGKVRFTDVSDTTAVPSNVLDGKYFYLASGERAVGSNQGFSTTNLVMGTFTGTNLGTYMDIELPYTGTGYPIAVTVAPKGGIKASAYYNTRQQYAVGYLSAYKSYADFAPTFQGNANANQYTACAIYKSSASSATSTTRTSGLEVAMASGSNASSGPLECVTFKSKKRLSVFIASTSFGLMPNIEYSYVVVYSI